MCLLDQVPEQSWKVLGVMKLYQMMTIRLLIQQTTNQAVHNNSKIKLFLILFLFFQQDTQQIQIGEGRVIIGCIQDGFPVIRVVFDLLGIQLGGAQHITAEGAHQQAGNHRQLHQQAAEGVRIPD